MITGRCECGRVRYEVDGDITDFSHCHCSQCRRLHSAAAGRPTSQRRDHNKGSGFMVDKTHSDCSPVLAIVQQIAAAVLLLTGLYIAGVLYASARKNRSS